MDDYRPDCHIVSVTLPGMTAPVAACGNADRASIVQMALQLVTLADPRAVEAAVSGPRCGVPTDYHATADAYRSLLAYMVSQDERCGSPGCAVTMLGHLLNGMPPHLVELVRAEYEDALGLHGD